MSKSGIDFNKVLEEQLDHSTAASIFLRITRVIKDLSKFEAKLIDANKEDLIDILKNALDEDFGDWENDEDIIRGVLEAAKRHEHELLVKHEFISPTLKSSFIQPS